MKWNEWLVAAAAAAALLRGLLPVVKWLRDQIRAWQYRRPKQLQERRKKRLRDRRILGKLLRRDEDWDRPEDETRRHGFQGRCRHRSSWRMDPRLSIGRVRPGRRREQTAPRGDRVTRIMWSDRVGDWDEFKRMLGTVPRDLHRNRSPAS